MKNYLLFSGNEDIQGGMLDFIGDFESIAEAMSDEGNRDEFRRVGIWHLIQLPKKLSRKLVDRLDRPHAECIISE